jgi:LmbE family N-acetylglucosaminyl deacetylase
LEVYDMSIFKNRLGAGRSYFLFAIALSLFVFPLPTQSANEKQDPTLTSKQIEALPQSTSLGQSPDDRIALYQALLDLTNPWTVMCVAAHPDDEDGTSLIVMRRKYGAHTVSLFSTFGEGGQNAIGPELYEELGAIRARETMAAAEIQGSEPHFLGLKDFGYSKTRDEAFKFWGHEEGLRRMVLEIRKLRPDVIITNHSTTSNDHGQHQATARIVVEAFDAAADPNRFPEQLKDGVTTWQVQRLFVRARGNATQNADAQIVTIDPNDKDPVRGVVYAEEALRALQKHATQGPWPKTFAEYANRFRAFSGQQGGAPGQLPLVRYALVREAKGAAPLSAKDSHNFVDGLRLPDPISAEVAPPTIEGKALTEFVDRRDQVLNALGETAGHKTFYKDPNGELFSDLRRTRMVFRFEHALAAAMGVSATLTVSNSVLIPAQSSSFQITVSNRGTKAVRVQVSGPAAGRIDQAIALSSKPGAKTDVPPGQVRTIPLTYNVPEKMMLTVPHAVHLYDEGFAGKLVYVTVFVEPVDPKLPSTAYTRFGRFPITASHRFDVTPPVEIANIRPTPFVLTSHTAEGKNFDSALTLSLLNHTNAAFTGTLLTTIAGASDPLGVNLTPHGHNDMTITARRLLADIKQPSGGDGGAPSAINLVLEDSGKSTIASQTIPVVPVNAAVAPSLRIGYIRGFDFSLPNALNALGVESKELSVDEVSTTDLSKFTSVIVDNRVYESKPELIAANQKLLDYANAGGNLIVFYHKSDEWNPDPRRGRPQLAPYKLILGNERLTDENAPITFIEPDHPLLNFPNKMGQDDFKDWIQERGLYYPREWDPQFRALLQSNDPGEAPLKGGLLVADYGRGHYIYTSMVWYRELRGGVPGAYRMLANMISYGRN